MPDATEHPEHDPQAMACVVLLAASCGEIDAVQARSRMIADDDSMIANYDSMIARYLRNFSVALDVKKVLPVGFFGSLAQTSSQKTAQPYLGRPS